MALVAAGAVAWWVSYTRVGTSVSDIAPEELPSPALHDAEDALDLDGSERGDASLLVARAPEAIPAAPASRGQHVVKCQSDSGLQVRYVVASDGSGQRHELAAATSDGFLVPASAVYPLTLESPGHAPVVLTSRPADVVPLLAVSLLEVELRGVATGDVTSVAVESNVREALDALEQCGLAGFARNATWAFVVDRNCYGGKTGKEWIEAQFQIQGGSTVFVRFNLYGAPRQRVVAFVRTEPIVEAPLELQLQTGDVAPEEVEVLVASTERKEETVERTESYELRVEGARTAVTEVREMTGGGRLVVGSFPVGRRHWVRAKCRRSGRVGGAIFVHSGAVVDLPLVAPLTLRGRLHASDSIALGAAVLQVTLDATLDAPVGATPVLGNDESVNRRSFPREFDVHVKLGSDGAFESRTPATVLPGRPIGTAPELAVVRIVAAGRAPTSVAARFDENGVAELGTVHLELRSPTLRVRGLGLADPDLLLRGSALRVAGDALDERHLVEFAEPEPGDTIAVYARRHIEASAADPISGLEVAHGAAPTIASTAILLDLLEAPNGRLVLCRRSADGIYEPTTLRRITATLVLVAPGNPDEPIVIGWRHGELLAVAARCTRRQLAAGLPMEFMLPESSSLWWCSGRATSGHRPTLHDFAIEADGGTVELR